MKPEPPTLKSVSLLIEDCLHATAPVVEEGFPLIRTPNIGKGRLDLNGVFRVTEDIYEKWTRRAVPQNGDLILAREAPAGNVAIVKNGDKVCLGQRTVLIRPDPDKVDPDFLCYYLLAPIQQGYLLSGATGVTAAHVNMKDIRRLPLIDMPKLDVQRREGALLFAYDELMENNRRRMELLEEAARLLYREWFVRLRFPGHEHARLTNGIPEGWEPERVGNLLAKIETKKRIPKDDYLPEGPIPCVDQSADFIGGFTDDEMAVYSEPLPVVVFGDHTRALKFVNFAFARGADGTQVIYPNTDRISSEYLYLALREIDLSNYFYARHFKFLKEKELLLPEFSLVREFTAFSKPCFEQIQVLRLQNQKLRAARDLLLPRLMSGEIAV